MQTTNYEEKASGHSSVSVAALQCNESCRQKPLTPRLKNTPKHWTSPQSLTCIDILKQSCQRIDNNDTALLLLSKNKILQKYLTFSLSCTLSPIKTERDRNIQNLVTKKRYICSILLQHLSQWHFLLIVLITWICFMSMHICFFKWSTLTRLVTQKNKLGSYTFSPICVCVQMRGSMPQMRWDEMRLSLLIKITYFSIFQYHSIFILGIYYKIKLHVW